MHIQISHFTALCHYQNRSKDLTESPTRSSLTSTAMRLSSMTTMTEHVGRKNIRLDSPHPKELPKKNPATPPDMITPESHLLHRRTRLEVYIHMDRNLAFNKALSTQYSCGPFGDLSKLVVRAKLLLM